MEHLLELGRELKIGVEQKLGVAAAGIHKMFNRLRAARGRPKPEHALRELLSLRLGEGWVREGRGEKGGGVRGGG